MISPCVRGGVETWWKTRPKSSVYGGLEVPQGRKYPCVFPAQASIRYRVLFPWRSRPLPAQPRQTGPLFVSLVEGRPHPAATWPPMKLHGRPLHQRSISPDRLFLALPSGAVCLVTCTPTLSPSPCPGCRLQVSCPGSADCTPEQGKSGCRFSSEYRERPPPCIHL